MSNLVINKNMQAIESALVRNDISKLNTEEKMAYYNSLCESVGLNPMTKPFAFLTFQGREVVYATKDCAEQLRKIHGVSTQILSHGVNGDFYEVHVRAQDKTGRADEDFAVIPLHNSKGNDLANIKMKCFTKAKRRVTLSICGLGILDESELDTLRDIKPADNPQIVNPLKEARKELEQRQEAERENLGDYVCKIGKKYNGKKLSEIDMFELDNYVRWLIKQSQDKQKPLEGDWLEFYNKANDYLASIESAESTVDEIFDLEK